MKRLRFIRKSCITPVDIQTSLLNNAGLPLGRLAPPCLLWPEGIQTTKQEPFIGNQSGGRVFLFLTIPMISQDISNEMAARG